jgi:hypothetical protein
MKLIPCLFCGFVFEPWPWIGYDAAGRKVNKLSQAESVVTLCQEHDCVCCPICFMCQKTPPAPALIAIGQLRRFANGTAPR